MIENLEIVQLLKSLNIRFSNKGTPIFKKRDGLFEFHVKVNHIKIKINKSYNMLVQLKGIEVFTIKYYSLNQLRFILTDKNKYLKLYKHIASNYRHNTLLKHDNSYNLLIDVVDNQTYKCKLRYFLEKEIVG